MYDIYKYTNYKKCIKIYNLIYFYIILIDLMIKPHIYINGSVRNIREIILSKELKHYMRIFKKIIRIYYLNLNMINNYHIFGTYFELRF